MPLKNISCQMGALTESGMTAVILAHSNADATLTINGVDYPVAMTTEFGGDRASPDPSGGSHICYIGTQVITGLSALTEYPWIVTQGADSHVGTQTTSTLSKAAKVAVALTTCFYLTSELDVNGFTFLRHYIDTPTNPPLLAILHSDDICYADGGFGTQHTNIINSQNKQSTGGGDTEYDYALFYASWFGILDTFYDVADTGFETPLLEEGLTDDMQYVLSRTAFMPSAGDHEYDNNLGWGVPMNTYPNAYHKTGALSGTGLALTDGNYDGVGLATYDDCMKPLQGASAVDTANENTKLWSADFGSFRYIAMDATTYSVKNVTVYGIPQINDAISKVDGTQWWHCFSMPISGCRAGNNGYPTYSAWVDALGIPYQTAYKNENFVLAEHNRMWRDTGQTPKALMDNSFSNGVMGMSFIARGDWHQGLWCRWTAPIYTGLAAENINEIGLNALGATAYSGTYFHGGADRDTTMASDNCQFVGALSKLESDGLTQKLNFPVVTIVEIDGEKATPEMVIKQWSVDTPASTGISELGHFTNQTLETQTDAAGNIWRVLAEKRFVRHAGNAGYDLDDTEIFQYKKIGCGDAE